MTNNTKRPIENRPNNISPLMYINFTATPTIVETSQPLVEAEIGDAFELECKVDGNPIPEVKWHKGDFVSLTFWLCGIVG